MGRTVGLIQAHMGSSRFPGKVLKEVDNKTLLGILVERASTSYLDEIAVITSGSPVDDVIIEWCKDNRVKYYRGSNHDVLDRYYRAAKYFKADIIVRLLSDCPMTDPGLIDKSVMIVKSGLAFATNFLKGGNYPDGMDVAAFTMDELKRVWLTAEGLEREHVTWAMEGHLMTLKEDLSHVRLTVDYPEDLANIKKVYRRVGINGSMMQMVRVWNELGLTSKHRYGENWKEHKREDHHTKGDKYWNEVVKVIPDGVQTFSKNPRQFATAPKLLSRGKGCRVWDMDGNEFIDCVLGLGTVILGHCDEEVNDAVSECANDTFVSPSLPHPYELKLAKKMCDYSGLDMAKFAKGGSDVTTTAVRLARYVTGKDKVLACGYHGWHDWYIGSTPKNYGVPESTRDLTKKFPYQANIQSMLKDVAIVILEPMTFTQDAEWLEYLRDTCNTHGGLLCFDNVAIGLRSKPLKVVPDLACYGKALGNGYPISVLCGKEQYMKHLDKVFLSSTHGGELPSITAALKVMEIMERDKVQEHIEKMGKMFIDGYNRLCKDLGVSFTRASGFGWWPRYDFDTPEQHTLFQQELVKNGVLTRNTPFICYEHKEPDIKEVLVAVKKALIAVREATIKDNVKELLEGEVIQSVIRDELINH